jgi:hypothetical protein
MEAYKDVSMQGLSKLGRILITILINNIMLLSESRAKRYAQVPQVVEHMSRICA